MLSLAYMKLEALRETVQYSRWYVPGRGEKWLVSVIVYCEARAGRVGGDLLSMGL
jgi:hypothetical protein